MSCSCTAFCDKTRGAALLSEVVRSNAGRVTLGFPAQAPTEHVSLMTWVTSSPFMLKKTRRGFEEKWHKTLE